MKNLKRTISSLLVLVLLLSCAACMNTVDEEETTTKPTDNIITTTEAVEENIANTYLEYCDYSEGLAWIKYENKNGDFWGCINKSGEVVFDLSADDIIKVTPFSNGYAYIEQNECYKTIDNTGKTVATYNIDDKNSVLAFGDGYVLSKKYQADFDSSEYTISVHNIDGSIIDSFSDDYINYDLYNYCGKGVFELSNSYDEVRFFSINSKKWIDYEMDTTNCYYGRNVNFYDDKMLVGIIYTDDNYSFEYMDTNGNFTSDKFGDWNTDFGYIWKKEPGPINDGVLAFNCGSDEYVGLFSFDFSTGTMKKIPDTYRDKVIDDDLHKPLMFEDGCISLLLRGSDDETYVGLFDSNWKAIMEPIKISDDGYFPVSCERLVVKTTTETVVYDLSGQVVFTPSNNGYYNILPYADDVARVEGESQPTYLDKEGNLLFDEIDMSK